MISKESHPLFSEIRKYEGYNSIVSVCESGENTKEVFVEHNDYKEMLAPRISFEDNGDAFFIMPEGYHDVGDTEKLVSNTENAIALAKEIKEKWEML